MAVPLSRHFEEVARQQIRFVDYFDKLPEPAKLNYSLEQCVADTEQEKWVAAQFPKFTWTTKKEATKPNHAFAPAPAPQETVQLRLDMPMHALIMGYDPNAKSGGGSSHGSGGGGGGSGGGSDSGGGGAFLDTVLSANAVGRSAVGGASAAGKGTGVRSANKSVASSSSKRGSSTARVSAAAPSSAVAAAAVRKTSTKMARSGGGSTVKADPIAAAPMAAAQSLAGTKRAPPSSQRPAAAEGLSVLAAAVSKRHRGGDGGGGSAQVDVQVAAQRPRVSELLSTAIMTAGTVHFEMCRLALIVKDILAQAPDETVATTATMCLGAITAIAPMIDQQQRRLQGLEQHIQAGLVQTVERTEPVSRAAAAAAYPAAQRAASPEVLAALPEDADADEDEFSIHLKLSNGQSIATF
ncbi:hypothetical protein JKP88DRAFT_278593 [Tribonema minus]|uniref:Uncharacterized protein n=1 Tax=Tribonema minus TaxID=303371 RepID=A0A836CCZ4_9STRA|nr:hypothetical protein JKP88DRAFT_278593 [Tribonema minus]